MSNNLYAHREQQNNERFDDLALTLRQFRTTVDADINGAIHQENSLLDSLNDNFLSLMLLVRRTSGDLRTVITRNASLSKTVAVVLLVFFAVWTLWKLK